MARHWNDSLSRFLLFSPRLTSFEVTHTPRVSASSATHSELVNWTTEKRLSSLSDLGINDKPEYKVPIHRVLSLRFTKAK